VIRALVICVALLPTRALAQDGPQQAPAQEAAPEATAPTEEEIAARALERALVQRGAVLLAPWRVEAVAELVYGHDSSEVSATLEGGGFAPGRVRAHLAATSLGVRVGLPGKFQVEGALPFVAAQRRTNVGTSAARADVAPGVGDVRLALARHVLSSKGNALQLLVGGAWRAPTGRSPYGLAPDELGRGQGVHSLSASATIVKISDPLVLLATGTYTANLARNTPIGRVDLADTVNISLSSLLAVTPQESLSVQIGVERGGDVHLDGSAVVGTDRTSAIAQLGVSTVLSKRVLLTVAAAMGITGDAPDFQLGVSVPVRF
jgi:Putative MetA-pathway of phenol degradation